MTARHIVLAAALIREEEALAIQAYPDPASPLGRALVKRHGPNACLAIGGGRHVDPDLLHLRGDPWTVGYGQTGKDIRHGTVWSRQHAEDRLQETLNATDALVCGMWPGAQRLHDKARAGLVSLVYNRGSSLTDPDGQPGRRQEMRDLGPAILAADYEGMAKLVEGMKRLWEGKGLGGLIRRRAREVALMRQAGYEAANHPPRVAE